MTGFRVLLLKELLESWRTRRLPAVVGLFIVLGIISPLTARYMPEILKAALGSQLTVPVPIPTAADAILQVQKNLGQLGAFTAIVLAMGAVAAEKERGTAAFILTKPASRGAFLGAKLAALGLVLALATLVSVGIAWAYTAVLFEPGPIGGWVALAVLAWLALAAWSSITFLASTVSGSSALAAGVGVVALIGLSLIGAIPQVGRFLPAGLDGPAQALAAGVRAGFHSDELATAVLGSVVIVVGSGVLAWLSFRRQEL
jgi:ABC-2 type transport system permease protein